MDKIYALIVKASITATEQDAVFIVGQENDAFTLGLELLLGYVAVYPHTAEEAGVVIRPIDTSSGGAVDGEPIGFVGFESQGGNL
jgi:hypothetical protein